ncbi:MAG: 1-deoxy-D-xylulose-5-phosphate synthase, partial [candidate division Zixibacteria bacterium]|nr:1-deoxy-D-xylulose-5-phosphate synthase [candidate division Zixibacteria bacterium]
TVALHYVFDSPSDKLIWDVSHQSYAHKLLTGRRDSFHTIRQHGGLSGFTKRSESDCDPFGAGHASTSISAALGFAAARDNAGLDYKVVAIIGDGSLTGGLAFEGMNNAGSSKKDLLVVLNDNTWSISKNVGAISKYLTNIMSDEKFNRLRDEIWEMTGRFKRRDRIRETIAKIEKSVKGLLVPGMLFQNFGFRYFGPIDGHDLPLVIKTLQRLKNLQGPIMLHVATVKGKGYEPAEGDPTRYHGVGRFDKVTGKLARKSSSRPSYTSVFSDTMVELGRKDKRVIAVTAAMATGTGLDKFASVFPERFFDVGIAEAHASCFAAGLAAAGARPYVAVYSTFMQRAYDQIIHDIALQELPVVFCMDRAGLVGEDGPTHHGAFDLSYLGNVPNLTVAAPADGNELRSLLHYTIGHELPGPVALRYPRAEVPTDFTAEVAEIEWGKWELQSPLSDTVILATGSMVSASKQAAEMLAEQGLAVAVVNARFVKPFDSEMLQRAIGVARAIVTVEENSLRGGFGQTVGGFLLDHGYQGRFKALGLPDRYVTHGNRALLLKELGLDAAGLAREVAGIVAPGDKEGRGFLQKLMFRRNGVGRKKAMAHRTESVAADDGT